MEVLSELWQEEINQQHIRISLPRRPALPCGVSQQHLNQSVASLEDSSSPPDLRRQTIDLLWKTRIRLDLQRRYGKGGGGSNNGLKTPQVSPVDMEIIKEEQEDEGP